MTSDTFAGPLPRGSGVVRTWRTTGSDRTKIGVGKFGSVGVNCGWIRGKIFSRWILLRLRGIGVRFGGKLLGSIREWCTSRLDVRVNSDFVGGKCWFLGWFWIDWGWILVLYEGDFWFHSEFTSRSIGHEFCFDTGVNTGSIWGEFRLDFGVNEILTWVSYGEDFD